MTCHRVRLRYKERLHVVGAEPRTVMFDAIVCDRGSRRRAACQEPHCAAPHVKLCDFPVIRKGKAGTCDRRICVGHAVNVGPELDYCQAHARAKPPDGPPLAEPVKESDQLSLFDTASS